MKYFDDAMRMLHHDGWHVYDGAGYVSPDATQKAREYASLRSQADRIATSPTTDAYALAARVGFQAAMKLDEASEMVRRDFQVSRLTPAAKQKMAEIWKSLAAKSNNQMERGS